MMSYERSADFLRGFQAAIDAIGNEGDRRFKDWSEPYIFLQTEISNMRLERRSLKAMG